MHSPPSPAAPADSPLTQPSTSAQTLSEQQSTLQRLQATEVQLQATRAEYERKMQRSRRWNLGALALAALVCAIAWFNQGAGWLRWGLLPAALFMTLLFEGMRRLMWLTVQSSQRQLQTQIRTLQEQIAQAQRSEASPPDTPTAEKTHEA